MLLCSAAADEAQLRATDSLPTISCLQCHHNLLQSRLSLWNCEAAYSSPMNVIETLDVNESDKLLLHACTSCQGKAQL